MELETINEGLRLAAIALEGIAALSAITYFKRYRNSVLKFLPIILCYTFFTEVYSAYIHVGPNNSLFYNISSCIIFNYFYWVYLNNLRQYKIVAFLKAGIVFYNIGFIIDAFANDFYKNSLLISYVIGGGLIILCAIFYYMQKLETENDKGVKRDLLFWISTGLLLFFVGYLPIKLTRTYFSSETDHYNIIWMVQLILIIVLNLCYTLGFKWAQKK